MTDTPQNHIILYEEMVYEDPGFPVVYHDDALIGPQRSTYTNWHNGVELLYCLRGAGNALANQEHYAFAEGELVVIGSGVIHTITAVSDPCEYYCIIVDLDFLLSMGLPKEKLRACLVVRGEQADACMQIIMELEEESEYFKPKALSMLLSLFVHLYRAHPWLTTSPAARKEGKQDAHILKALSYIRRHLHEQITLDTLCHEATMSRYHFCRLFHEYTGMTPVNYINMLRCTIARCLMLENGLNVSEAAKKVGVSNLSYFAKMYKKYMVALPSQELQNERKSNSSIGKQNMMNAILRHRGYRIDKKEHERKKEWMHPMEQPLIIGYLNNNALMNISEEAARKLTHINLAFGTIRDGLLDTGSLPAMENLCTIRAMNPDLKILLSIGGWTCGGFSPMAMSAKGRMSFAGSVVRVMDRCGLDGVDIDWEYPCDNTAGIEASPRDRENFTRLLQSLRDTAGQRIVSIAAGALESFLDNTEMDRVAQYLDYVQLMTYDMRAGFSKQTCHHTGLYQSAGDSSSANAADMMELFHQAGVPYHKLVIGAAFYSRRWRGVPAENNGLLQRAQTVGNYGPTYRELVKDYIGRNGYTRYWDDEAKAPYLFNGSEFISYDDAESIRHKCAFVQDKRLRGIMYWDHSSDDAGALLSVIAESLRP